MGKVHYARSDSAFAGPFAGSDSETHELRIADFAVSEVFGQSDLGVKLEAL